MTSTKTEQLPTGSKAAAISNLTVRTLREYTGRGPTKARTYISDDIVTVVLQDSLTRGERSLVRDGLGERVQGTRKAFQATMRDELVSGIEAIVGRPVVAFMSDNLIDPDIGVEVFLLAPMLRAQADGA
jgi:uncharacterized protein YbcI